VPGYTIEPTPGELSLGTGRKRSGVEEYELGMVPSNGRTSGDTVDDATQPTTEPAPTTPTVPATKPSENLPPYIPPPPPALIADGNSFARVPSRPVQNSAHR
jgi:hypothetical protein